MSEVLSVVTVTLSKAQQNDAHSVKKNVFILFAGLSQTERGDVWNLLPLKYQSGYMMLWPSSSISLHPSSNPCHNWLHHSLNWWHHSHNWCTISLQPLPYLVAPYVSRKCQLATLTTQFISGHISHATAQRFTHTHTHNQLDQDKTN